MPAYFVHSCPAQHSCAEPTTSTLPTLPQASASWVGPALEEVPPVVQPPSAPENTEHHHCHIVLICISDPSQLNVHHTHWRKSWDSLGLWILKPTECVHLQVELLFLSLSILYMLLRIPYVQGLRRPRVSAPYGLHCYRDVNVSIHKLRREQRMYNFLLSGQSWAGHWNGHCPSSLTCTD